MTVRHQIELDITFFLVAGAIVGFVFALYSNRTSKTRGCRGATSRRAGVSG